MPKFPLPEKFLEGDTESFKKNFERVAKANGWNDDQQLAALPLALGGRALLAFEREEAKCKTVAEVFKVLVDEMSKPLDKECALKEFYSTLWGPGLSPQVYASKLKSLLEKGLPSLGTEDKNRLVVNQFVSGFPSDYRNKLSLIFSGKTPKIDEVVAAANDLLHSSDISVASVNPTKDTTSKLDDLMEKFDTLSLQVAAIATTQQSRARGFSTREKSGVTSSATRRRQIRCFNCSGFGHIARDCASPRQHSGNGRPGGRPPTASPRDSGPWSA